MLLTQSQPNQTDTCGVDVNLVKKWLLRPANMLS